MSKNACQDVGIPAAHLADGDHRDEVPAMLSDTIHLRRGRVSLISQYSFLLMTLVAIGLLAFFLLRDGARSSDWIALASLALGFMMAYGLAQPGPSTAQHAQDVLDRLGVGQPVLLELQSPYCLGCMAARPIVDKIEREHARQLVVIRMNVQEPAGRAVAERFGFRATPTFILFDRQGTEIWRSVGIVDPTVVRQSLSAP